MASTMTCRAGSSPPTLNQETKRHSRSLDLGSTTTTTTGAGTIRHHHHHHHHQRSASESDGIEIMMAATKETLQPKEKEQKESISLTNSVFSMYKIKKLGSTKKSSLPEIRSTTPPQPFFNKSRASIGFAFASFRQPSINSKSKRYSCVSTPVSSSDAADDSMNPPQATTMLTKYNTINEEQITIVAVEEEEKKDTKPTSYPLEQARGGESKRSLPSSLQQEITQFAIDGFALKYFATHKRGLFRRTTVPIKELLRWTKDAINKPLLLSSQKESKDTAIKCFKILQQLMQDRPRPRQFDFITSLQHLLSIGITKGQMRDEIYVQICRQLNKNPRGESIRKGWEILCVISVTFPPSKNLESYLFQFVQQHHHIKANQVDVFSTYVSSKLERICSRGARGKVLSAAEIERAMEAPFKPSVFGESLDVIMEQQKNSDPTLKIPKIVMFLTNAVHELNGKQSEGIFRVPGDADTVTELRIRIENGNYDSTGIEDPNVPASLIKYWLRDLSEPLIPTDLYQQCVSNAHDKVKTIEIIHSLPETNRRIVLYMISFLQEFTDPKVTQVTLMNVFNLAMVFAPNFLRCPSVNLKTIFENSKYEQMFLKTLITELKVVDQDTCAYNKEQEEA